MTEKRSRGRPRGSGINDDVFLRQVANRLIKTPEMKPTTAMKRILSTLSNWPGASREAALRRWQEKWKAQAETLLNEARARAASKPTPSGSSGYRLTYRYSAFDALQDKLLAAQRIQDMIDPPTLRYIREQEDLASRTMREALEPYQPILQQIQEATSQQNPLKQAMDDLDPIGTAIRNAGLTHGPQGYY